VKLRIDWEANASQEVETATLTAGATVTMAKTGFLEVSGFYQPDTTRKHRMLSTTLAIRPRFAVKIPRSLYVIFWPASSLRFVRTAAVNHQDI